MKNGKLFSKLSVIDLAVILLVLLIAVVAVVRIGFFGTPEQAVEQTVSYEKVECLVTLQFQEIEAKMLNDAMTKGETMYASGKVFGTVESFECVPATLRAKKQDGTIVTVKAKDEYNYNVTVKATLTQKDGMLYSGKIPVGVGLGQTFVTHYFSGKAYVMSVEKIQ